MSQLDWIRSLIAEAGRRHVLRIAVVYVIAWWVVIQVSDIMVPRLGLPAEIVTGLIVLMGLGFPVALMLTWALELRPDGRIVRTPPTHKGFPVLDGTVAADAAPPTPATARRRFRIALGVLVVCGAAIATFGAMTHRLPWPRDETIRSIAVLPFVHMSAAPELDYMGDGIAEELLDQLAAVRGLDVVARTSSFQFRDSTADVRDIGRQLDVEAVLEGSVRRSGDRLRVAAQLISTATGFHLWSGIFDRTPVEVFALQSEIAAAIADTVELRFLARGAHGVGMPASAEAAELYWAGLHAVGLESFTRLIEGIDLLRRATAADSTFARAHAALALALVDAAARAAIDTVAAFDEARTAAGRAIALDEDNADAHAVRGYLLARSGQTALAEEAFQRALLLNGNHVQALRWYAELLESEDRPEEAAVLRNRVERLDPMSSARAHGERGD
jgi:adenylate cyclase